MTTRRLLITGLISFIAAPAIVRAASLMPVKGVVYQFKYRGFEYISPVPLPPELSALLVRRLDDCCAVLFRNMLENLNGSSDVSGLGSLLVSG